MQVPFNRKLVTAAVIAMMAPASIIASESEIFSLIGQPDLVLEDGSDIQTGTYNGIPYEVVQGYAIAQGDMVLGRLLPNQQIDASLQTRGLGQASAFERWVDGIIPYQFSDGISQSQRDKAQIAVEHWNSKTSIKLVSRTAENADQYSDYINFEVGGGCASYVGKTGGEQSVWLADSCTTGSIIHEIGHAIGLFHEHTRPDRDNYVTVNLQNISSGKEINFDTIVAGAENFSEYDYGSIMHYGEFFFSSNGDATIVVPDGQVIGQRDALSERDISSVNRMYATDLDLTLSTIENPDNSQIDLVVSNIGDLGASDVQITASWGNSADWLSFTEDTGWACRKFGVELRCTKTSISETDESRLSILVNADGAAADDLQVRVESRTLDTNLDNNVYNDVVTENSPAVTVEPEPEEVPVLQPAPEPEPELIAGNSVEETTTTESTATNTVNEAVTTTAQAAEQAAAEAASQAAAEAASAAATNAVETAAASATEAATNAAAPTLGAANESSSGGGAAFYLLALLFSVRLKRRS